MPQQSIDPRLVPFIQKIARTVLWIHQRIWLVQLMIGLPMLITGYNLGRIPLRLILKGDRTIGQVVEMKKVQFSRGRSSSTTEYLPIIEVEVNGIKHRFQSTIIAKSNSTGYPVQVIIDKENPSLAMQDHPLINWFPWSFFVAVGLILTVAGLNSFRKRNPTGVLR